MVQLIVLALIEINSSANMIMNEQWSILSLPSHPIKVYHIPDPSAPWSAAFETTLGGEDGFPSVVRDILRYECRSPHMSPSRGPRVCPSPYLSREQDSMDLTKSAKLCVVYAPDKVNS